MSKWRSIPAARAALPIWLGGTLVLFVCGLAYGPTLAPGATWANHGYDSGELIAAVITGGVPHPSGYPTYLLLAGLLQLLPLLAPPLKVSLLSALAASLTALVLYATLLDWLVRRPTRLDGLEQFFLGEGEALPKPLPTPTSIVAATLAALLFALAPLVWSQAVIAEVYTLSALGGALLLRATLARVRAGAPGRHDGRWSLLAGLALGVHLTVLPLVLAWLAIVLLTHLRGHPPARSMRGLARRGLPALCYHLSMFALGALVYLLLPLRAAANPPINWGAADQWAGFWWLVSGRLYAGLLFGAPLHELPASAAAAAALLARQLGLAGLLLASLGLLTNLARHPVALALSAGPALIAFAFTSAYATYDAQVYLLPTIYSLALWAGLGAHQLLTYAAPVAPPAGSGPRSQLPPASTSKLQLAWAAHRMPQAALALAVSLALLWSAPQTARQVDASSDLRAITFAQTTLDAAPPAAIILTAVPQDTFAIWSEHFALGRRPDLAVVAAPLLSFAWYRANLRLTYAHLNLPVSEPAEGWEAALAAFGPLCRTTLTPEPALLCP